MDFPKAKQHIFLFYDICAAVYSSLKRKAINDYVYQGIDKVKDSLASPLKQNTGQDNPLYLERETHPEKQTALPWRESLHVERESVLKTTATKYVSIWISPCLYQTVYLKGP